MGCRRCRAASIESEAVIEHRIKEAHLAALRDARADSYDALLRGLEHRLYHKLVFAAAKSLNLPVAVTPHTFRRGAASEDYSLKLRDMAGIQQRGRWRSSASARRYQKFGRLLSALRRGGDAIVKDVKFVDAEHLAFLL